ncbi:glycosyltransferase family 4 protein [Candidatus Saccharibacteria bacterium]|nr:glycosyltransferase family 4 protein [Candidatus Saccharibacteria bacterium]MBI3337902.1 glycosyltransferase family 4 protein [Candidatus Saccharibacteria bacterium]
MKKIVIDAREFGGTGGGTYLKHLLQKLQEIDNNHKYVVLLKPKDMDSWKPVNRKFEKLQCNYKEFTFAEQIGLFKQLRSLKADLVHFPMTQQPVLYRGKVVTTINDLTTVRFRNPSKNWLIFTIKRWVYKWVALVAARKSKALLTYTEFVKNDVAKFAHVNSRKITVTYLAADKITEEPRPVENLENVQFIMYVGRPQPHKNLDRLVEAFTLIKQTHPELKLVLAGKKDVLYRRIATKIKYRKIPDIIFTGFVDEGQLRWLYEHTACYVFPSLSEGFGLPGLEAMNHGAPVVSSNATCLPEVYGDAAEYFDPLNVEEMAQAIAKVIDKPKRRDELVALGKKQANKYSWQRMAEQTLAVYKEALGD